MVAKPAKDLTPDERRFALQYLFQANPQNMIGRYPRYRELWERFREHGDRPERAERYFQAQDFTDLQVLSQIAWFDEFFLEETEVAALVEKGAHYSLEDQKFVIAREREMLGKVLPAHAEAAQRRDPSRSRPRPSTIRFCRWSAIPTRARSRPPGLPLPQNRFRHPEDAREQLARGLDLHEKVFGMRPQGVWPSEGSVSEEALAIAHSLGVQWMATDEGVLGRSSGFSSRATAMDGCRRIWPRSSTTSIATRTATTAMHMVFRDHTISDLIGFVYSGMPPRGCRAASDRQHPGRGEAGARQGTRCGRLDHSRWRKCLGVLPEVGTRVSPALLRALQRDPGLEAVTISEAIARTKHFGKLTIAGARLVDQRQLQRVDRRSGRQSRLGLPVSCARVLRAERRAARPKRSASWPSKRC